MFVAALLLTAFLAAPAADDVVTLVNGDRISGKVLSKGKRTLRVQTPVTLDRVEAVSAQT